MRKLDITALKELAISRGRLEVIAEVGGEKVKLSLAREAAETLGLGLLSTAQLLMRSQHPDMVTGLRVKGIHVSLDAVTGEVFPQFEVSSEASITLCLDQALVKALHEMTRDILEAKLTEKKTH